MQRRFVHGPGADEPLVQYEGIGTTDRRWLHADERGSVIAISDAAGNATTINRYDEYGKPQATNTGRFQYTGQMWLPELGAYYYKARVYAPHLGRFLQTDPIGYDGGMNLYAYVGNDPVNLIDPLGLQDGQSWTVTGLIKRIEGSGRGTTNLDRIPGRADSRLDGPADCVGGGDSEACTVVVTGKKKPRLWADLRDLIKGIRSVFCAIPAIEFGGEVAYYRGFGSRASGAVAYNTATGDVYLKGSFGGGIGAGSAGSFGFSAQSSPTSEGTRGSLDSRVSAGAGLIGFDATYNLLTVVNAQNVGSQGASGSVGIGKAFLPGSAYVAPLEANISSATRLGNLGTPCG